MKSAVLRYKPARRAGYEFGLKFDKAEKQFSVGILAPLNYDQVMNHPQLDILLSLIDFCPTLCADIFFESDPMSDEVWPIPNNRGHFTQKEINEFDVVLVYGWSLFQVKRILTLLDNAGYGWEDSTAPAILAPLNLQTRATTDLFHQFIPMMSPGVVVSILLGIQTGILDAKSPDFIDMLEKLELETALPRALKLLDLPKSWLEFSREFSIDEPVAFELSENRIRWNLSDHLNLLNYENLFLMAPLWHRLKMETWLNSSKFEKIRIDNFHVTLGEQTKVWFLTELKKYPCPLNFRLSTRDDLKMVQRAIEEYASQGWDAFTVDLFLVNPDELLDHISDILHELNGRFKVKWSIHPDYMSIARHNRFSDEIYFRYQSWIEKGNKLALENAYLTGNLEDLKFLLLLFQNKINLVSVIRDKIIQLPMFSLMKDGVIAEKSETISAKLRERFATDAVEPAKTSVLPANKKFGRGVKRRGITASPLKRKVRIKYQKLEAARYFGHSDIMRIFRLTCKKAGVAVIYTGQKNPKPSISYGPSLPAGCMSLAEYADFFIEMKGGTHLAPALNPILPEGIHIIEEKNLVKACPSLASSISVQNYAISGFNWDINRIHEFLQTPEYIVERQKGEKIIELDIKPFVAAMELRDGILEVSLHAVEGRMARIDEVLNAVCDEHPHNLSITRTSLFIEANGKLIDPIQVE